MQPPFNSASPIEEALARNLPELRGSLPTGSSLAASLLGCALEENKLELRSMRHPEQTPDMVEAQIVDLILMPESRANRVMQWAFTQTDEWEGMTPQDLADERRDQLSQNLKQLEACETQEEAAQCLLDVLMEAIALTKDPPPLDRE